jgi:hypothetical protein
MNSFQIGGNVIYTRTYQISRPYERGTGATHGRRTRQTQIASQSPAQELKWRRPPGTIAEVLKQTAKGGRDGHLSSNYSNRY